MRAVREPNWQPIETAPKDGTVIRLRRVTPAGYNIDGKGRFGPLAEAAPSRQPLGPDPLFRLSAADYAAEERSRTVFVEKMHWTKEDGMYLFPTPTHWAPIDEAPS